MRLEAQTVCWVYKYNYIYIYIFPIPGGFHSFKALRANESRITILDLALLAICLFLDARFCFRKRASLDVQANERLLPLLPQEPRLGSIVFYPPRSLLIKARLFLSMTSKHSKTTLFPRARAAKFQGK